MVNRSILLSSNVSLTCFQVLENRTKASQREMEMLETLEDLRELNSRHAKVDHEKMIMMATAYKEQLARLQEEEDEKFIK